MPQPPSGYTVDQGAGNPSMFFSSAFFRFPISQNLHFLFFCVFFLLLFCVPTASIRPGGRGQPCPWRCHPPRPPPGPSPPPPRPPPPPPQRSPPPSGTWSTSTIGSLNTCDPSPWGCHTVLLTHAFFVTRFFVTSCFGNFFLSESFFVKRFLSQIFGGEWVVGSPNLSLNGGSGGQSSLAEGF